MSRVVGMSQAGGGMCSGTRCGSGGALEGALGWDEGFVFSAHQHNRTRGLRLLLLVLW